MWKLNNELLQDPVYKHETNTFLEYWSTQRLLHNTKRLVGQTKRTHKADLYKALSKTGKTEKQRKTKTAKQNNILKKFTTDSRRRHTNS